VQQGIDYLAYPVAPFASKAPLLVGSYLALATIEGISALDGMWARTMGFRAWIWQAIVVAAEGKARDNGASN